AAAAAALRAGQPAEGDASLLPAALEDASASEIARVFGADFAAALDALPVGGWHGPLRSSFGVHLVELRARTPGRRPTLDEARAARERDWLRAQAEAATDSFYAALRERYDVRIEDDGDGMRADVSASAP